MADFKITGETALDGSGLQSGLSSLTVAAGNLIANFAQSAAQALGQALQAGVDFNAQMETYTTNFTTMLGGNADAAGQLVSELQELGAATPLAITDLTNAAQTLLSFGATDASTMTETLTMIGDVALGDATKMQSLALAYGQMVSTGKLQGQDLLQMINAGFNPLQELSEMGYGTVADLKEKMSKGAISVEMVQNAFAHATGEGGKFYGAMEAASHTFSGQLSTLQDNATALAGALTEGLTGELANSLLPLANDIVGQLTAALQAEGAAGMLTAAGSIAGELIGALASNIPQLAATAADVIVGLCGYLQANSASLYATAGELLGSVAEGILTNLPRILAAGISLIGALAQGVGEAVPGLLSTAWDIIVQTAAKFGEFDWGSLGMDMINGIMLGVVAATDALINAAVNAVKSAINAAKSWLGIRSPSRRGKEEVGKPFVQGIAGGVDETAGEAVQAARTSAEEMLAAARSAVHDNQRQTGSAITATGTTAQTALNASWRGESVTVVELDGREVARATAPYMDEQLDL